MTLAPTAGLDSVCLQFCGATRVITPKQTHDVAGRPQRSLLAVLALRPNTAIGTDQIVEWTWGAKLPANPRGALHTRVSRLRNGLGELRDLVTSTSDGYQLNIDGSHIDVARYERAVSDSTAGLDGLIEANAIWSGTPFVDTEQLPVLVDESRRLTSIRSQAQHQLVLLLRDAGRRSEALALCESALRDEPFDEAMMRVNLELNCGLGNERAVAERYHVWRSHYVEVFETSPPPELDELADRLDTGSALIRQPAALGHAHVLDALSQAELVGDHVQPIVHTTSPITIVYGTAGSGKTALAAAWRSRGAGARGDAVVLHGGTLADWASSVDRLPAHHRSSPLIIEDVHLANPESWDGFETFILSRASQGPVLLTARPLTVGTPAHTALARLSRHQHVGVFRIPWLGDAELQAEVERRFGALDAASQHRLSREILKLTGGQPSAVDLVVRSADKHARSALPELDLLHAATADIVDIVGAEFSALEPEAAAATTVLSVTQRPLALQQLVTAVESLQGLGAEPPATPAPTPGPTPTTSATRIAEQVAQAESAGLVALSGPDEYRIASDAVRWAVRKLSPDLFSNARSLVQQRAADHGDQNEMAMLLFLDPEAPASELAAAIERALDQLDAANDLDATIELGELASSDQRLVRASDREVARVLARLHLATARAAESRIRRGLADYHWDAALEIGIVHDFDGVVADAGVGSGLFGRPGQDSPSARRLNAATAWAKRHGATDTQIAMELEDLRRSGSAGRHIEPTRLAALTDILDQVSANRRAEVWATIAGECLSRPLSKTGDRLHHALEQIELNLRTASKSSRGRPDAELALSSLSCAVAIRRGDASAAEQAVAAAHGTALYLQHPRRIWFALAQRATLEAMLGNVDAWRSAFDVADAFGRANELGDVDAVKAAHLVALVNQPSAKAAPHGVASTIVQELADVDLGDIANHPVVQLGVLAAGGTPGHHDELISAWNRLEPERPNLFSPLGLMCAAWAEARIGPTPCRAAIHDSLAAYSGEFAVLPAATGALGWVDDALAAIAR